VVLSAPSSIARAYTSALHHHFDSWYATWLPDEPLRLGDYGILTGSRFERLGSVEHLGVGFSVRTSLAENRYEFATAGAVELRFSGRGAAAGEANARARLEISFAREKAFYFVAANCGLETVEDQVALGEELKQRAREGGWNTDFVVVTSLLRSGATTIVGSQGNDALVTIEAAAEAAESVDLGAASGGVQLTGSRNVGLRIVAQRGLTPLVRLSRVLPPRPWRSEYRLRTEFRVPGRRVVVPASGGQDHPDPEPAYVFAEVR
jgi:hypothetical protein